MIDWIKRYPVVIVSTAVMLTALGGTLKVALPVEEEFAALQIEVAQRWEQQSVYHNRQELDAVRWRMRWVSQEINRIKMIPTYLKRPLTEQESWQVQQLQDEWKLLKEREMDLSK